LLKFYELGDHRGIRALKASLCKKEQGCVRATQASRLLYHKGCSRCIPEDYEDARPVSCAKVPRCW